MCYTVLLFREDDTELVNTLANVYQAYHVFPLPDFVLDRLVKQKDVENLKRGKCKIMYCILFMPFACVIFKSNLVDSIIIFC